MGGGGQTFLHTHGGANIFTCMRGQTDLHTRGGQTFSVGGGSANDDVDCQKEGDVSEAEARISRGPEILVLYITILKPFFTRAV